MDTREISSSLEALSRELVQGVDEGPSFILNPGDAGLVASLQRLSSDAASATSSGGASIAAHVEHASYAMSLINRWAAGENPYEDTDWPGTWKKNAVSEGEWQELIEALRREADRWVNVLASPRDVDFVEVTGMIASIAHLAYHLGAMRQIDRSLRGPSATG